MDIRASLSCIIGIRIKEVRQNVGMNQQELAEKIELTRTSISNIEAGRQLAPLDVLYKICHALGTELPFLLPNYSEIFLESKETLSDKLKTKDVPEGSREAVKSIIENYKRQYNEIHRRKSRIVTRAAEHNTNSY